MDLLGEDVGKTKIILIFKWIEYMIYYNFKEYIDALGFLSICDNCPHSPNFWKRECFECYEEYLKDTFKYIPSCSECERWSHGA